MAALSSSNYENVEFQHPRQDERLGSSSGVRQRSPRRRLLPKPLRCVIDVEDGRRAADGQNVKGGRRNS